MSFSGRVETRPECLKIDHGWDLNSPPDSTKGTDSAS